jgi:DNA-binding NarL/FixJ family response regulator
VPEKKIRVVLGDLQTLNLEGMNAILKGNRSVSVVATADDPKELAAAVKKKSPDVVVVDSQMLRRVPTRGINGHSKVIQLVEPGTAISTTPATMGVVKRNDGVRELKDAIRRVARGETYELPASGNSGSKLSRREQDITRLVARGLSNRAIADDLGLSEQSVKNLVSRILKKFGMDNRVQLALAHQ